MRQAKTVISVAARYAACVRAEIPRSILAPYLAEERAVEGEQVHFHFAFEAEDVDQRDQMARQIKAGIYDLIADSGIRASILHTDA